MVLSSRVDLDKGLVLNKLDEFKENVLDLGSTWQGESYNNLSRNVSEFVSSYRNIIDKQMSTFSQACDLYSSYKEKRDLFYSKKNKYMELVDYRKNAIVNKNKSDEKMYADQMELLSSEIKELQNVLFGLKDEINSLLDSINEEVAGE